MADKNENKQKTPDVKPSQRVQLVLPAKFFRRLFLVLAALTLFFLFIWHIDRFWHNFLALLGMLTPFIVAVALAFVIKIPMNAIERQLIRCKRLDERRGFTRVLSIVLSLFFVIAILIGVVTLVLPQVVQSMNMLVARMPSLVRQLTHWMEGIEFLEPYADNIRSELGDFSWSLVVEKIAIFLRSGAGVFDSVITAVSSVMSGLTNAVIAFLFMLYLLAAKEIIGKQSRRLLYSFTKESVANKVLYVFRIMHNSFTAFVSSTVLGAVLIGIMIFIGMVILRIPYAGMVSVVVGVLNLIPIIGSIVGVGLGTLIVLLVSPIQALVFLIVALILNQIEGNILFPRLAGKAMGLPTMWILLAISLGGSLMGIIGIWIFVPLFSSLYTILAESSAVRLKMKMIDIDSKTSEEIALKVRMDMGMDKEEALLCDRQKTDSVGFFRSGKKYFEKVRTLFKRNKNKSAVEHIQEERSGDESAADDAPPADTETKD